MTYYPWDYNILLCIKLVTDSASWLHYILLVLILKRSIMLSEDYILRTKAVFKR